MLRKPTQWPQGDGAGARDAEGKRLKPPEGVSAQLADIAAEPRGRFELGNMNGLAGRSGPQGDGGDGRTTGDIRERHERGARGSRGETMLGSLESRIFAGESGRSQSALPLCICDHRTGGWEKKTAGWTVRGEWGQRHSRLAPDELALFALSGSGCLSGVVMICTPHPIIPPLGQTAADHAETQSPRTASRTRTAG